MECSFNDLTLESKKYRGFKMGCSGCGPFGVERHTIGRYVMDLITSYIIKVETGETR